MVENIVQQEDATVANAIFVEPYIPNEKGNSYVKSLENKYNC